MPVRNGFLRFTSGATPADYIVVSIATEPFRPSVRTVVAKKSFDFIVKLSIIFSHLALFMKGICLSLIRVFPILVLDLAELDELD